MRCCSCLLVSSAAVALAFASSAPPSPAAPGHSVGGAKLVAVTAASYESARFYLATLDPSTGRPLAVANVSRKVGSGLLPCNLAVSQAGVATVATLYEGLPQVASDGTLVDKRTFGSDFLPVNMQRDRTARVAIVQVRAATART